jgi:hypothetical protein
MRDEGRYNARSESEEAGVRRCLLFSAGALSYFRQDSQLLRKDEYRKLLMMSASLTSSPHSRVPRPGSKYQPARSMPGRIEHGNSFFMMHGQLLWDLLL